MPGGMKGAGLKKYIHLHYLGNRLYLSKQLEEKSWGLTAEAVSSRISGVRAANRSSRGRMPEMSHFPEQESLSGDFEIP